MVNCLPNPMTLEWRLNPSNLGEPSFFIEAHFEGRICVVTNLSDRELAQHIVDVHNAWYKKAMNKLAKQAKEAT